MPKAFDSCNKLEDYNLEEGCSYTDGKDIVTIIDIYWGFRELYSKNVWIVKFSSLMQPGCIHTQNLWDFANKYIKAVPSPSSNVSNISLIKNKEFMKRAQSCLYMFDLEHEPIGLAMKHPNNNSILIIKEYGSIESVLDIGIDANIISSTIGETEKIRQLCRYKMSYISDDVLYHSCTDGLKLYQDLRYNNMYNK